MIVDEDDDAVEGLIANFPVAGVALLSTSSVAFEHVGLMEGRTPFLSFFFLILPNNPIVQFSPSA
jgi:hypothetical protein